MYAIYNMIDQTYYGSKDTQIKVYKTKINALKQLKHFMRKNTFLCGRINWNEWFILDYWGNCYKCNWP